MEEGQKRFRNKYYTPERRRTARGRAPDDVGRRGRAKLRRAVPGELSPLREDVREPSPPAAPVRSRVRRPRDEDDVDLNPRALGFQNIDAGPEDPNVLAIGPMINYTPLNRMNHDIITVPETVPANFSTWFYHTARANLMDFIQPGNDYGQRSNSRYQLQRVAFKMHISVPLYAEPILLNPAPPPLFDTSIADNFFVRMALVYDRFGKGADLDKCFKAGVIAFRQFRDPFHSDRYDVLHDEIVEVPRGGDQFSFEYIVAGEGAPYAMCGPSYFHHEVFHHCKKMVEYDDSGVLLPPRCKVGSLYLLFSVFGDYEPAIGYDMRLTYCDNQRDFLL